MSSARTGRQIILDWLYEEMRQAKTADLHRMAGFLAWAREIRKGCDRNRRTSRKAQLGAWRKKVDQDVRWGS
jgi:hypothetical protein